VDFLEKVPDGVLVGAGRSLHSLRGEVGLRDSVEAYRKRKNLLILRTFSKVYGLAGLRIGYAIGKEELLTAMNKLGAVQYFRRGAGGGFGGFGR